MSVTPALVNLNLAEGGSTVINKVVSTPAIPPNPDIVFLTDTTTSMGPVISNVQANIGTILTTIRAAQPNANFAVAMYKDTADQARGIAFFTVLQNLTADSGAVQSAINHLTPLSGGGSDAPEDAINALFQVASGAIAFRPQSTRIVVWIGDASSHDPSNGHTLAAAIAALQAAHIQVLALDVGPTPGQISDGLNARGQATSITAATNGTLLSGVQPGQVSNVILSGLQNLPVTVRPVITASDPVLSASFSPASQTVQSGSNALFQETVHLSTSAAPGSGHKIMVTFLLNEQGSSQFQQIVSNQTPRHTSVLRVNSATSDYHDPGVLAATLTDGVTNAPIAGATVKLSMGAESGSGVTNAAGQVSVNIVPQDPAGTYPIQATFDGDPQHIAAQGVGKYVVTPEETTTEYTGPTVFANNSTITLTGVLKEDGVTAIAGRTLTFTLGSGSTQQTVDAITDATGTASVAVMVHQPLGTGDVAVSFAGDAFYEPSSNRKRTLLFEFAHGGAFVIADGDGVTKGEKVVFWGAQWAKSNRPSGGEAPASFKGFVDSPATPSCNSNWSSSPGNSSSPPDTIPSIMGVIVATSIRKQGNTITGDCAHVMVVRTDPGYGPNPGHPGTGTVIGRFC